MNSFRLEIFDDQGSECTFYTVRWEDSKFSETEKFFQKFRNSHSDPIQELAKFLELIGEEKGALEAFFRFENFAHAIPRAGVYKVGQVTINYMGFPLRLYCLRLSDSLVILFNGGEKNSRTAQGGDTSMAFHDANRFARRISSALSERDIFIELDGRTIKYYDGSDEIII